MKTWFLASAWLRRVMGAKIGFCAFAALLLGCANPPPTGTQPGGNLTPAEILLEESFEKFPIGTGGTSGLVVSSNDSIVIEWQEEVSRTGNAAYHMRGGNLRGDATIRNQPKILPLGGLEVWVSGAFRFVSFPVRGPIWIMGTAPTDGILGADDKPVVAIDSNGRLVLQSSNSRRQPARAVLNVPLQKNRWYNIVLHGRNGPVRTQELYLYDGETGVCLGQAAIVLNVAGTFLLKITKWGFGTSQDSTGLEYYLDDIHHASGRTFSLPTTCGSQ